MKKQFYTKKGVIEKVLTDKEIKHFADGGDTEAKRELAKKLGADIVCNPNKENLPSLVKKLNSHGADVVLENVGHEVSLMDAFKCIGKRGKLILAGLSSAETKLTLPPLDITKKELSIKGAFLNPNTFSRAIDLISSGKFDLQSLITDEFSLHDIKKAMKVFEKGTAVKILIRIED